MLRITMIFGCSLLLAVAIHVSPPTREEAISLLKPYSGPAAAGVNCSTLQGKIMCGYQGWFTTPGDGSQRGWSHYGPGERFGPGHCSIDLWPDVSQLDDDEKFASPFHKADDSIAYLFSSHSQKTVLRHFQWMQEYGIDGVFVQRFAVETISPDNLNHCNTVLVNCREGANRYGRAYAVMYDLSGLREGQIQRVIDDWKLLVERMDIGNDANDKAYLHHHGKPVVAVWGIGFNDGRKYTLDECETLIQFFKHDPQYGGFTVIVGVPTGWRTLDADSVPDKKLHEVLLQADIISPWTVGRYNSPEQVSEHAKQRWQPDLAWCREHDLEYLPVAFPGFSWHNMKPRSPLNQIPRRKGEFLWAQYDQLRQSGATMIYQAMFDEMDEGTAIFKCSNSPPIGESKFVDFEGLPSDHYLWLCGIGGKLLRGEISASARIPDRQANP